MAAPGENLRINPDRLWDSLMEMAKIGPGVAGGNNRQTLTDEDGEGRHLFKRWCEEAGLEMGVDQMGTMFARREGTDPDALPVYVGSHLDTQPTGGKFDGVLGVLGGLEVVRSLNDLGIKTKHPIVVTNWTNEEGTRFAPAMLASGVFAGVHKQDWAYDRKDAKGKRFGDELERIGWKGDEEVGERKMHAFFELHIEQGPILEDEGIDIGVVTHGQGLKWLQVTLTGKESHTGSTPMPKRRNAGLGMARVTELVHEVAMDYQPDAVGAVGHMEVYPNSRNIIAGRTVFTIDIRSPDKKTLDAMDARIRDGIATICEALDIKFEIEQVGHFDPVTFDENCVKAVRDAAERLGYIASQHRLRRRPRRLLDQPRRADGDGDVPLRRRAVAQRGRGHLQGMGGGRRRRAVPRGGRDGGDCGVRVRLRDAQRPADGRSPDSRKKDRGTKTMSKVIKNGTIVTADRTWKADVLIKHGKIVGIGPDLHGDTSSTPPAATSCRAASIRTPISKCRSWAPIRPTISRAARARRCRAAPPWWSISACRRPASRCSKRCRCGTTRPRRPAADYSFHMAITWWGEQVFNEMATSSTRASPRSSTSWPTRAR